LLEIKVEGKNSLRREIEACYKIKPEQRYLWKPDDGAKAEANVSEVIEEGYDKKLFY